MLQILLH